MSNICRRCGSLVEYSLVPLSNTRNSHCHFCIREFKDLSNKLDREREKNLKVLKNSAAEYEAVK